MFRQLTYADFNVGNLIDSARDFNLSAVCCGDNLGVSWIREDDTATEHEQAEYEAYERRLKEWN